MSALPRGRCPECSRDVALRRNGQVREHLRYDDASPGIAWGTCGGSGRLPVLEREPVPPSDETDVATPPATVDQVTPGRCALHPSTALVTHKEAGLRWYGPAVATVCPAAGHTDEDRERCRWCGGPLFDATRSRWRQSDKRTFCSDLHRLHAFRARARAERQAASA